MSQWDYPDFSPSFSDPPICGDCAMAQGATWPDGHCATFWPAECSVCKESKSVCAASDWNWPDRRGHRAREF